jgi:hypothetical protein
MNVKFIDPEEGFVLAQMLDRVTDQCQSACPLWIVVFGLELGTLPDIALSVQFAAHRLA